MEGVVGVGLIAGLRTATGVRMEAVMRAGVEKFTMLSFAILFAIGVCLRNLCISFYLPMAFGYAILALGGFGMEIGDLHGLAGVAGALVWPLFVVEGRVVFASNMGKLAGW